MSWLERNTAHLLHGGETCNASTFYNLTTLTTANQTLPHADDLDDDDYHKTSASHLAIGVALSIVADTIIAISLNVMKLAHNRNAGPDGKPIKPFTRLRLWWVGILLNISGEVGNLLAYGYAPAAIVAPVGSVGVVVNQIIAVFFLREPLRKRDMLGLVGVVGGVVLIILGVPESDVELTVHVMLTSNIFLNPRAYWYLLGLFALIVVFMKVMEPRYAHKHIFVWLIMCSVISSWTVIAARGFSSLLTQMPSDCAAESCEHGLVHPPCATTIAHWFFWVLLACIAVTAIWSALYLNKAMQVYGNTQTVPVYYCTFNVASILGGAVVYNEFADITVAKGLMFGFGILLAFLGVGLITSDRQAAEAFQSIDDVDDKVDAIREQGRKLRHSLSFGGSFVQASIDHDAAVDPERLSERILSAHYPTSYEAAMERMPAGRLVEMSLRTADAELGEASTVGGEVPPGNLGADAWVTKSRGGRRSGRRQIAGHDDKGSKAPEVRSVSRKVGGNDGPSACPTDEVRDTEVTPEESVPA